MVKDHKIALFEKACFELYIATLYVFSLATIVENALSKPTSDALNPGERSIWVRDGF